MFVKRAKTRFLFKIIGSNISLTLNENFKFFDSTIWPMGKNKQI